ncbi:uncharacterized protein TNCV_379011 [Trichonephila clavipes]|nr:uncharacterized protein TNCV_379011 [Trichonephila clavipes]
MRQAIWAIFLHKLSTDEYPQYGFCPIGEDSWCGFKKAEASDKSYKHKNSLPVVVVEWLATLTAVLQGLCLNPGEDMDVFKCIVPLQHEGTLNSRQAASPLVKLAAEERGRKRVNLTAVQEVTTEVQEESSGGLQPCSTRGIAGTLDGSVAKMHKILRNILHCYPYQISHAQKLLPSDLPARETFALELFAWKWTMNGRGKCCRQTKPISILQDMLIHRIAEYGQQRIHGYF